MNISQKKKSNTWKDAHNIISIRDMQIKITVSYHFTLDGYNKKDHKNCWPSRETERSYTADGNVKQCSCFGKQFGDFLKH